MCNIVDIQIEQYNSIKIVLISVSMPMKHSVKGYIVI